MKFSFNPIILDEEKNYRELFSRTPQKTSDYSFINLWGWSQVYDLKWAFYNDIAWIIQHHPTTKLWAPVGNIENVDWKAWFDEHIITPVEFVRVPEWIVSLWEQEMNPHITIYEAREEWDYIYSVEALSLLKGNRFHKKKNLVNQFKKKYDYTYIPLEGDAVKMALSMQSDWCTWKDCEANETLLLENRAIQKVLSSWDDLNHLIGGAILVNDKMVCYTIAECISKDTLIIHFEKGNPEFKGSYQAINQMFLSNLDDTFLWVNREQDLGDEGLRKAKLSYHPNRFEKKFRVKITPATA